MSGKAYKYFVATAWVWYLLGGRATAEQDPAAKDRCRNLITVNFATLRDAPTRILSADLIPADKGMPEFCEVTGYVRSNVQFALRMPTTTWNGKLFFQGCGGYCGHVRIENSNAVLRRGYSVTATDMGHISNGRDAEWAYNNREAEIDFGYRATHVTAEASKAILAHFYGKPQAYAYFSGCSGGGRQGLVAAQRFPHDFDGIIAGAPNLYSGAIEMQRMWNVLSNFDEKNNPILRSGQLALLQTSALQACDDQDGLKDGVIEDPRKCKFEPAGLLCKETPNAACLTQQQIDVVRKIYRGPLNSKGVPLSTSGMMPGSEQSWAPLFIPAEEGRMPLFWYNADYFRYMAFSEDPGPAWDPRQLDWDKDPPRLGATESILTGGNPDLRRFKARGGKMIGYHGWGDPSIVATVYPDYYEMVSRIMGGDSATQEFFRLFMIPGMNHCGGGNGAVSIDYLAYLEDWVEKGKAPDVLHGRRSENGVIRFARPFFPYPDVARYAGTGDVNDAANFRRVRPIQ